MLSPIRLVKSCLFRSFGLVQRLAAGGERPTVLLTFDDGPHPEYTAAILDRLQQHRARAIFFVVGREALAWPNVLRRAEAEGHVLANHTFTHRVSASRHPWAYFFEVWQCQAVVDGISVRPAKLFRPPGGKINPATLLSPLALGLRTLHWSVDPRDYRLRDGAAAQASGRELAAAVQSGDIVLLHDDHPFILPLLDELLPRLVERGFDLQSGVQQFLPLETATSAVLTAAGAA